MVSILLKTTMVPHFDGTLAYVESDGNGPFLLYDPLLARAMISDGISTT